MTRFEHILVYAEGDDSAALERVVEFATTQDARITVCDVVALPPTDSRNPAQEERLHDLMWTDAFERLRRLCAPHQKRLPIDYTVLSGHAFLAITEQVVRQRFDLVVHLAARNTRSAGVGLDATDMHLVRKCPCAVWTLPPGGSNKLQNIVLAVDRDHHGRNRNAEAFTRELARTALLLAQVNSAVVHVVHAWQVYGRELLEDPRAGLGVEAQRAHIRRWRDMQRRWFEQLVAEIRAMAGGRNEIRAHLPEGDPAEATAQILSQVRADLLVMGTIGTSSVPGLLIGTTAETLLARIATAVFSVKPSGFTSPLKFGRRNSEPQPEQARFQSTGAPS